MYRSARAPTGLKGSHYAAFAGSFRSSGWPRRERSRRGASARRRSERGGPGAGRGERAGARRRPVRGAWRGRSSSSVACAASLEALVLGGRHGTTAAGARGGAVRAAVAVVARLGSNSTTDPNSMRSVSPAGQVMVRSRRFRLKSPDSVRSPSRWIASALLASAEGSQRLLREFIFAPADA